MTDTHYDELETRSSKDRESVQFEQLRSLLAWAPDEAPGLKRQLEGIDPETVTDRDALAVVPVLRKSDLIERQKADPPLGGLTPRPLADFSNIFQSPGPIYEPGMTGAKDWWRFARALHAAGIRDTDIVLNSFAYNLTPAGHMMEAGARALGCTVLAGGTGNSEGQARAAADIGVTAYIGTPDFLKTLLEKATVIGADMSAVTKAFVSAGPLFSSLRDHYADQGISCLQGYGTADVGLIAYETMAADGRPNPGMVVDEGVIVEIVTPGTGDPVPEGEVGELLVTALNPDYPLVRFATGDLSAFLSGASPCGRTGQRIKSWMGRADQTAKVRGMFVRPEQVAEIVRRHPEIARARLVIGRESERDTLSLRIEPGDMVEDLAGRVRETAAGVLKLSTEVETVPPGDLPKDGKVIDDTRDFDRPPGS